MKTISSGFILSLIILTIFFLSNGCEKNEPAKAGFSISASVVETGQAVQFTNESQNASHYQWEFGDGRLSFEKDPSHTYTVTGVYQVKLIAIGKENSDSVSMQVTVNESVEPTIFEGKGIEGIDVQTPWKDIYPGFTTDSLHFINYFEDYDVYYHRIYYLEDGIGFGILSADTLLKDDDPMVVIMLFYPYSGTTAKRIAIGSLIDDAISAYGTPNIEQGTNFTGYYYESIGIDFYTFDSDYIEEIQIYQKITSNRKSKLPGSHFPPGPSGMIFSPATRNK